MKEPENDYFCDEGKREFAVWNQLNMEEGKCLMVEGTWGYLIFPAAYEPGNREIEYLPVLVNRFPVIEA